MKKALISILLSSALILSSCSLSIDDFIKTEQEDMGGTDMENVKMIAEITAIGEKIEVNVTESEYTFGVHWVNIDKNTKIYNETGLEVSKTALAVGDIVQILYSGQVMMSYPPQIVALRIIVK